MLGRGVPVHLDLAQTRCALSTTPVRSAKTLRPHKSRMSHAVKNACAMAKKFPLNPAHPERTCWGCDRYCARDEMICGNGTERTQHPTELFGDGWEGFGLDPVQSVQPVRLLQPLQPLRQDVPPASRKS